MVRQARKEEHFEDIAGCDSTKRFPERWMPGGQVFVGELITEYWLCAMIFYPSPLDFPSLTPFLG